MRRKKIVIGEKYIFDVMNESNMAVSTTLVTVIKPSKRKHYYVMSVNTGDIFECKEDLLIPYVDPKEAVVIRCQYGTTDFTKLDVEYFDVVESLIELNLSMCEDAKKDNVKKLFNNDIDETIERFKYLLQYNQNLKNKVEIYYGISDYKYNISRFNTIKNNAANVASSIVKQNFNKIPFTSKPQTNVVDEGAPEVIREMFKKINNSEFYHKFDNAVRSYMEDDDCILEEFVDTALDILEDDFPEDAMIPDEKKFHYIGKDDINCLKQAASEGIKNGFIVFLVGMTSDRHQIALAVYDMSDFCEIDHFIETVYDKWEGEDSYYVDHRIVMLSVPKKPPKYD